MEKIKKLWNAVSYEVVIAAGLTVWFLTGRALDLQGWSSAWNAMDYSMGTGSRLLIGSIYRLFYGEYLDYTVAYKYVAVGTMLTILVLAIVLGRMIRLAVAKNDQIRHAVLGAVALYLVAPFSIAYVWNDQNLGRLDVYMLLVALLALLVGLAIKNTYVKCVCYTLLGVVGLAIHQGFAFLYYPIVFSVMVYDVFEENRVHAGRFAAAFVSGLINVAVAVYFQFFSSINFDSAKELVTFLEGRTNLTISEYALDIEYFLKMDYQLKEITPQFYKYDAPIRHALLVLLLLLPVLVWCFQVYRDVFGWQKKCNVKWYASPCFYMLLSQLCFVPMFVIHTDWGRHFAPLFAMQIFMFLFYAAKGEPAMVYACEKMCGRMRKHPWIFIVSILWIAKLDSFGARDFLKQATYLFDFLQRGFFIN